MKPIYRFLIISLLALACAYGVYVSVNYIDKETQCEDSCQLNYKPTLPSGKVEGVRIYNGTKCVCVEVSK